MPPEEKGIQEYREQADALAYFEGAALILGSFLRFSMRPSLVTSQRKRAVSQANRPRSFRVSAEEHQWLGRRLVEVARCRVRPSSNVLVVSNESEDVANPTLDGGSRE
jgi:hypothetical protein